MSAAPFENVTWIRLEKPAFDLFGVIISSLSLTGICIGIALALGGCWGLLLIRRARQRVELEPPLTLRLEPLR